MPPPRYDREAWEDELKALRGLLAHFRHELTAAPAEKPELREVYQWKIKRAESRMADLRARLTTGGD